MKLTVPSSIPSSYYIDGQLGLTKALHMKEAEPLTRRGRNVRISLDVNTTVRIIRRQVEVGDRNTGEVVECLEGYILTEVHIVERRAESRDAKGIGRDDPLKARIVEDILRERRKAGESYDVQKY